MLNFNNLLLRVMVFIWCAESINNLEEDNPFTNILKRIINENQENIEDINMQGKFINNQKQKLHHHFSIDDEVDIFEKEENEPLMFIIVNQNHNSYENINPGLVKYYNLENAAHPEFIEHEIEDDELKVSTDERRNMKKLEDDVTMKIQRRTWDSLCLKKGATICKKACLRAFRKACDKYECKKKHKHIYKRDCEPICIREYKSGLTYSDSSSCSSLDTEEN